MVLNEKLGQLGALVASIADTKFGQDVAAAATAEPFLDALNVMLWSLTTSPDIDGGNKRPVSELSDLLADACSKSSEYEIHCTMSQAIVQSLVLRGYLERPREMDQWQPSFYKDTTEIVVALATRLIREMCEEL